MSLPLKAIERLFERLAATYGNELATKYGAIDLANVKTVWAHELDAFGNSLHSIAWALEHLPERCPNAIEFKKLCYQAPSRQVEQLPAPKADPERVAAELAKLAPLRQSFASPEKKDRREWARKIIARKESGYSITPAQLQMARNALEVA